MNLNLGYLGELMSDQNEYEEAFSENGFWDKLKRYAKAAGREVVEKALLLYYAMQEEKAPAWAKATIAGALGYFIVPIDAIADFTLRWAMPTTSAC